MHPAEIKAALTIAGYKQTDVARECGVAPTTIGAVINGRSRSEKVENWIAEKIRRPVVAIWPQWYGQETELVLDETERSLVRAFREASPASQATALKAVGISAQTAAATGERIVSTGSHARIAGRDFHEDSARKK